VGIQTLKIFCTYGLSECRWSLTIDVGGVFRNGNGEIIQPRSSIGLRKSELPALSDLPSGDCGEWFIRFFVGDGFPLKKNLI
jgi:hypothetical protein